MKAQLSWSESEDMDARPSRTPALPEPSGAREGAALSIERLERRFATRDGGALEALRDVSFKVEPRRFVSIVGPSGCGKSTLLMLVAGLQKPTSGRIMINDEPVTGPAAIMGVAFQRDFLLEWRTVLGNVLAQADLRGWKRSIWTERARRLLEMVGLQGFERSYPKELSGGMRQRVALCRALLHDPQILLLDEPFGAVDAMTREQLNLDVGQLCANSNVTTLLVTHDINEAAFMGDDVIVMTPRPGQIAGIVPVETPTPRAPSFRSSQAFLDATVEIRRLLEASHDPAPRADGGARGVK